MNFIDGLLPIIQIILSIALIILILLQKSDAGVGGSFGGSGGESGHNTRRGLEKKLFIGTIIVAITFAFSSFLALII